MKGNHGKRGTATKWSYYDSARLAFRRITPSPSLTTTVRAFILLLSFRYPVLAVGCYNAADLVGKALPAFYMPFKDRKVLLLVALQTTVLPLMIRQKISDEHHRNVGKELEAAGFLLGDDIGKLGTVALLGVLTGYSATCCLMVAPAMVKSKYKEYAAQFMSLCLIFGLFTGSVVGVLISQTMGVDEAGNGAGGASVPYFHAGAGAGEGGGGADEEGSAWTFDNLRD